MPNDDPASVEDSLKELWDDFNLADGTSAADNKKRDSLKADYESLYKSASEIQQVVEAYRKAFPLLREKYIELARFVTEQLEIQFDADQALEARSVKELAARRVDRSRQQSRFREHVEDEDEECIWDAVEGLAVNHWEAKCNVRKGEHSFQQASVAYDGAKKQAVLDEARFNELKAELKTAEGKLKAWQDLREKYAEKAYAEKKYERAYLYLVVLYFRLWIEPILTPHRLREKLIDRWQSLAAARKTARDSKIAFDLQYSELDQAKKAFDILEKQGVDDLIRELDLDANVVPAM
jgi:hypothetical protein